MKKLPLCLSTILFLNMGWSQPILKPSVTEPLKLRTSSSAAVAAKASPVVEGQVSPSAVVSLRLQQEERIKDFVKLWNQSSDFSKAIEQFAVSKEDKYFLQQVLKKEKMEALRPARIEYFPSKSKMVLNLAEGKKTLWVLAMDPSFVLYDGNDVLVFHPQSSIPDFFPEYKGQFEFVPPQKKKKKSTTSWISFWLPQVYAQTATTTAPTTSPQTFYDPWKAHNDRMIEIEKVNKKVAKKQKHFSQKLLMFLGIGAGISLFLKAASGSATTLLNQHWGAKGHFKLREDIDKLKDIYPEIDNGIFNGGPNEIIDFKCGAIFNKNAPVRKVSYQFRDQDDGEERSRVEIDLDLAATPSMKEDIIKGENTDIGKKIEILDRCCQNIPCEKWLLERLKDNQKAFRDGEFSKSTEEVGEFIKRKEDEVRKSIGTK